jgi:EAL domain-containing protein (putative c-di-GMP-specific phosphodiesterase class I)
MEGHYPLFTDKFLVKNDCHIFQGYLFSKPLPAPLFLEFANNVA